MVGTSGVLPFLAVVALVLVLFVGFRLWNYRRCRDFVRSAVEDQGCQVRRAIFLRSVRTSFFTVWSVNFFSWVTATDAEGTPWSGFARARGHALSGPDGTP